MPGFFGVLSRDSADKLGKVLGNYRPQQSPGKRRGHRRGVSRVPIRGVLDDELVSGGVATLSVSEYVKHAIVAVAADSITVAGDVTSELSAEDTICVEESTGNDGVYTVDSSAYVDPNTTITVDEAVPDGTADGIVGWWRDTETHDETVRETKGLTTPLAAGTICDAFHFGPAGYCVVSAGCTE